MSNQTQGRRAVQSGLSKGTPDPRCHTPCRNVLSVMDVVHGMETAAIARYRPKPFGVGEPSLRSRIVTRVPSTTPT